MGNKGGEVKFSSNQGNMLHATIAPPPTPFVSPEARRPSSIGFKQAESRANITRDTRQKSELRCPSAGSRLGKGLLPSVRWSQNF